MAVVDVRSQNFTDNLNGFLSEIRKCGSHVKQSAVERFSEPFQKTN